MSHTTSTAKPDAPTLLSVRVVTEPDEETNNNPEIKLDLTERANVERLRTLGRKWHYIEVGAEADILVRGCTQQLSSAGLWAIESDSGADYLTTTAKDQYAELVAILEALGVSCDVPFSSVEWVER
jgi:hypothetical protein